MRRLRRLLIVLAWGGVAALAGCAGVTDHWPPPGDEGNQRTPDPDQEVTDATAIRLHELVNEARATARSCGARGWFDAAPPLALEPRLTRAAQLHSEDMRDTGVLSHTGSDGSGLAERIDRQGYAWGSAGENVARGATAPEAVVTGWLGSDGHCANLMRGGYTDLGAGEAGRFWTLVFAWPR